MHSQEIIVEAAEQSDFPVLFQISSVVHATNYTELIPDSYKRDFFEHYENTSTRRERFVRSVEGKIQHTGYGLLKATAQNGVIVGYLSYEMLEDKTLEIRSLFVHPEYQGQGIGTKLMNQVMKNYGNSKMQLFVIEGNQGAITLYEKYGFAFSNDTPDKVFFGARLLHMSREPQ